MANAGDDKLVYLMPIKLAGSHEIEKQDIRLVIDKTEGLGGACRAKLLFADKHTESCMAVRKRTSLALEAFQVLNSCSHPNIAKPLGVWEDTTREEGYIVFQNFDGVLSSVPKEDIFEVDGESEGKPAIDGFSKTGFNIMRDMISAVKYVNDHYQQETTQTVNCIPLEPLSIETATVFYELKADGDYLVMLSHFDIYIEGNTQADKAKEKSKGANPKGPGSKRAKRFAKEKAKLSSKAQEKANAGNPGKKPDVQKICGRNWNNLGKYLALLYGDWSANFEVSHLVGRLKEETVKYGDLIWEAGLWDLSTRIHFIREICWRCEKSTIRKGELISKNALALQSCIDRLQVKTIIDEGLPSQRKVDFIERNLYKSCVFLRVFLVAHQAKVLEEMDGEKVDAHDQKSAERIVRKAKDDYLVNLIEEIKDLNWFKTSPYLRSGHDYMVEFQDVKRSSNDSIFEGTK